MTETMDAEKIRLSGRVRYRAISDEGVLVDLEKGRAMVVNEVGIYIVETLGRQDMSVAELADIVACAFEVDSNQARVDVAVFLEQLRGEGIIDIVSAGHRITFD